jgi:hypothetical protein
LRTRPLPEIAAALGCSVGTVKSRLAPWAREAATNEPEPIRNYGGYMNVNWPFKRPPPLASGHRPAGERRVAGDKRDRVQAHLDRMRGCQHYRKELHQLAVSLQSLSQPSRTSSPRQPSDSLRRAVRPERRPTHLPAVGRRWLASALREDPFSGPSPRSG